MQNCWDAFSSLVGCSTPFLFLPPRVQPSIQCAMERWQWRTRNTACPFFGSRFSVSIRDFFNIYNQIVTLLSPFFYFFLEKAKEEIRTANPNPYWEAEEEEGAVGCQQAATGHPAFVVQASVAEARTNQGLFAAGRRIYSKPRASQVCFFFSSLFSSLLSFLIIFSSRYAVSFDPNKTSLPVTLWCRHPTSLVRSLSLPSLCSLQAFSSL